MKELHFELGGRPLVNDDLSLLQSEIYKALAAVATQSENINYILSGCLVTPGGPVDSYNMTAGLVIIDGIPREIDEVTDSGLIPGFIIASADVLGDNANHETGGSKPTTLLQKAELSATNPGGGISITSFGGFGYFDAVQAFLVRTSGNQTIQGVKTFVSQILANGGLQAQANIIANAQIISQGLITANSGLQTHSQTPFSVSRTKHGPWDMDADQDFTIQLVNPFTGVNVQSHDEIISLDVKVEPNSPTSMVSFGAQGGITVGGDFNGWTFFDTTKTLSFTRETGGFFDNASYNAATLILGVIYRAP